MTKERMLKLLLLEKYGESEFDLDTITGSDVDFEKYYQELIELRKEFLRPYVIDNAPNGD